MWIWSGYLLDVGAVFVYDQNTRVIECRGVACTYEPLPAIAPNTQKFVQVLFLDDDANFLSSREYQVTNNLILVTGDAVAGTPERAYKIRVFWRSLKSDVSDFRAGVFRYVPFGLISFLAVFLAVVVAWWWWRGKMSQ